MMNRSLLGTFLNRKDIHIYTCIFVHPCGFKVLNHVRTMPFLHNTCYFFNRYEPLDALNITENGL